MDLSLKSLGNPWSVPTQYFVCGNSMGKKGWARWGKMVTCYACHCSFEVPSNLPQTIQDSPESRSSYPEIADYSF